MEQLTDHCEECSTRSWQSFPFVDSNWDLYLANIFSPTTVLASVAVVHLIEEEKEDPNLIELVPISNQTVINVRFK